MMGINVRIELSHISAANSAYSFQTVNVYNKIVRRGSPFKFYDGNVSMLADIRRENDVNYVARKFSFSGEQWQPTWGVTYIKYIEKRMKSMKLGESILWDLENKKEVTDDRFLERFKPPRDKPVVLFTSDSPEFRGQLFMFDKRPSKGPEDLAIFSALHYYGSCGVKLPSEGDQRSYGKSTMLFLAETFFNGGVPLYVSESEVANMGKFLTIKGDKADRYEELVTKNNGSELGSQFEAVVNRIFATSPFNGTSDELTSVFDTTENKYLDTGSIYLVELLGIGVNKFLEEVQKAKKEVEIEIDTMSNNLKAVYVSPDKDKLIIVPQRQSIVDWYSVFDSDNIEIQKA